MMRVSVGLSTCGIAAGAEDTYRALESRLAAMAGAPALTRTGCVGMCYQEPLVEVADETGARYVYGHVGPDKVDRLVKEHVEEGRPIAGALTLFFFFLGAAAVLLDHRFFDPLTLPPSGPRASVVAGAVLALLVWLRAQFVGRRAPGGA